MKFGKNIGAQQEEHGDLHYIDYKALKKLINAVGDELEKGTLTEAMLGNTAFEKELSSEVSSVNACFDSMQGDLVAQIVSIADRLDGPEVSEEDRADCFRCFADALLAMDRLRKFAVWNCVAVVKILKKRRKRTTFGLADICKERVCWLSQQSFFNGSQFAELHAVATSVAELLSSKLGQATSSAAALPLHETKEQCPICLEPITDAVELACKHRCCWKCFVLGPIAYQPGEYRMSHCPICRSETDVQSTEQCSPCSAPQDTSLISGGTLTRFLRTYFHQDSLEDEASVTGRQRSDSLEWKCKQSDDEMQHAVSELVRAVLGESGWQRSPNQKPQRQISPEDAPALDSEDVVPDDFFKTLPPRRENDGQTLATQKLFWLQQASLNDPLAVDDNLICILCSEMLIVDAIVTTPCKHHFHKVCIRRITMPECPLCAGPLPFSWFLPEGHCCVDAGFRVVAPQEYNPSFLGGPSYDSGGFPLHQPPPMKLLDPEGHQMKSYLHKASPIAAPSALAKGSSSDPSSALDEGFEDFTRQTSPESSSDSSEAESSDDEGSQDMAPWMWNGEDNGRETLREGVSKLHSAVGQMRRCRAPARESEMLSNPFACLPESPGDDGGNQGRSSSDTMVLRLGEFV
jgi:hypothetical protein